MPSVTATNVSSHMPLNGAVGMIVSPPTTAGQPKVTYPIPAANTLTINGMTTPKIDLTQHGLQNVMDFINGLAGAGVTASIDRYGRLSMSHPVSVVIGGDPATRLALGI
jgi:hypothetical protein